MNTESYKTYSREVYRFAAGLAGSEQGALELLRLVYRRVENCGSDPILWMRRELITAAKEYQPGPDDLEHGGVLWVLQRLDAPRRAVWLLKEIEQLGFDEIAAVLECKFAAARTRYYRAKEQVERVRKSYLEDLLADVRAYEAPTIEELEARFRAPERPPPLENPTQKRRRRRGITGVAAAAAVVVALFLILARPAGAGRSSLEFSPANPQRGDIIDVTYRPGGRFVDRDRLVLRGRLRTENKLQPDPTIEPHPVTVLTKQGREYRGSFVLSDSIVYGAFAVENERAEEVDSDGGRLWDLLTDEYAALVQLRHDLASRDLGRVYETARLETEFYPESPTAWATWGWIELMFDGDSVLPRHRAQYEALKARSDTTVYDVAGLYWYALTVLRDTLEVQQWENLLRERGPSHPYLNPPSRRALRSVRGLSETMREYTREPGSMASLVSIRLPDVPGLRELLTDEVAVIAQWTRFTTNAREVLGRLEMLQTVVPIVIVTRDAKDPPTTIPVVHDPNSVFARAFNAFGKHHYAVVDNTGRVRFEQNSLDPVLQQVTVLRTVTDDR